MNKKVTIITILIIVVMITTVGYLVIKDRMTPRLCENPFTIESWTRTGESDTEYINFREDGSFSYYCACGNGVDNYDICESYIYDEKTSTIMLECIEPTSDMITELELVSITEDKLEIKFGKEIRIFEPNIEEE